MHGNEPSGLEGLNRVLDFFQKEAQLLKGKVYGIIGNLRALQEGKRFIDRDLNRKWTQEKILSLQNGLFKSHEDREQLELYTALEKIKSESKSEHLILFDLHTTSSNSCPFQAACHYPDHGITDRIPVPLIQNIFSEIKNTLLDYYGHLGGLTYLFEGGQHEDSKSADNHEAYLWVCLHQLGMVEKDVRQSEVRLAENCSVQASKYDIAFSYHIEEGERFRMLPGFENFVPVTGGQALAENNEGMIYAPEAGRIFMPLYQPAGNEGFFILQLSKN